jgi:hypothetical protein
MQSKLAAAVALAKQGYRVFPLAINGKTPANDGNWRKTATTDPARIAEMWTCPVMQAELDYNIGIALDQHTLVVDVDVRDGKQGAKSLKLLEAIYDTLPPTYTVESASGGEHRYYKVEDSSVFAKTLATDIDLKGEGGYVVGPGSTIEDRPYRARAEGERAAAALPSWVREHAPAGRRDRRNDVGGTAGAFLGEAADTEAARIRAVDYLGRVAPDHGTYQVACRVKDFGVSRETCLELMMEHWEPAEAKGEEHVSFRVDNAYSYGQNAVGSASPEAEFDAVEVDQTKPPPRKGLYWTAWPETKIEADRPYLIDGVLETGTMIVTYGDSNTGKTFVALDQAYHIAAGKEWNGHKVKQGPVVYVASEGGPGFAKRIEALKRTHGAADVPFYTVPCLVDLYSDAGSTGPLVKLVREIEAHAGSKVALIVIDTLARAMGGGDENASTDMGKFVANCDRVRAATGAALNIVHHTGKDKARGARGSSALRAATDTEIEIDAGTLTMTKQRDAGKFNELKFTLDVVEVGRREDGAAVTSCVVRWLAVDEFSDEVSPQAEQMFEVLERLIAAKRDEIEEDETIPENEKIDKIKNASVPWKLWELSILAVQKGARGKPLGRTRLFPLRQELSNSGKIGKDKYKQWFIK